MASLPPSTPLEPPSSSKSKRLDLPRTFPSRAVMLAVLLVALPLAAGAAGLMRMRGNHWNTANLQIRGAKLKFAHQWNSTASAFDASLPAPGWDVVKGLCGEYAATEVVEAVWAGQPQVVNQDLLLLAACPRLQKLTLADCGQVSDEGLVVVSSLPQLKELELAGEGFTDAVAPQLAQAYQLQRLSLRGTRLTDSGLRNLLLINALRKLELHGAAVSEAALKELRDARRELEVVR